jgi:hypothetical protein
VLAGEEGPLVDHVVHVVPLRLRDVLEGDAAEPLRRLAGVGEHDVQPPPLRYGEVDGGRDLGLDPDVGLDADSGAARVGDLLGHP